MKSQENSNRVYQLMFDCNFFYW